MKHLFTVLLTALLSLPTIAADFELDFLKNKSTLDSLKNKSTLDSLKIK